ncbi:glycosyltransferase [Isoptericola sp. AK164]|uniref:glycosyltransferase n=1 Tax=Isoptericola sp. AK164 TaxID=3024246 RepID=UPI0024181C09|nr:glycosyltransferase [Isoptericola sp. AK164]
MGLTEPHPGRHDLVVFSLEPWDEVWRRNQHLVSRLLDADPELHVLFVEPPADPLHAARSGHPPRPGAGLHPVPGDDRWSGRLRLYQPTKWLPRRIDPHGDARRTRRAQSLAGRTSPETTVLWVNDLAAVSALDAGPAVLYDITDDWIAADRPAAAHDRLVAAESRLLREADTVVVCAPALVRTKGGHGRPPVLVTNGVDEIAYSDAVPRPADLPASPVALYVGTLHRDRLDVGLAVRTQRALADVGGRLVLVGPVALDQLDRVRLESTGVVLLGPRPFGTVPAYLRHADVLVVPHVVDAFTDSLNPIKLYEYRAAGRPVISTPVAGFRDEGHPTVTCAVAEEFPSAVSTLVRDVLRGTVPPPDGSPTELPRTLPTWAQQATAMAEILTSTRRAAGAVAGARTPPPRR